VEKPYFCKASACILQGGAVILNSTAYNEKRYSIIRKEGGQLERAKGIFNI
jgi:hypothetical protein